MAETSSKPADVGSGKSVVVPVYNSEGTLEELVDRLVAVLEGLGARFEILLVNDGSRDSSWQVIESIAARWRCVRGFDLMRNFGQHNALLCGIRAARYDVIVTIDDDLQNPPEEVPALIARLNEGHDVVYGYPRELTHGLLRNLASQLTKIALQKGMGVSAARHVSAFRAFRTEVRRAFEDYDNTFVSIDVLLSWGTTRFAAVQVRHEPRKVGVSGYTVRRLINHAVNMLTGFSTWPLQVASVIGFVFTLFGLGVLAFVISRYLISGTTVPGFPFLASIIAIFSGAQLFSLGIIGEYLARMYFRAQGRPSSVTRRRTLPLPPDEGAGHGAARVGGDTGP